MNTQRIMISNGKNTQLATYIDFPNFQKPKQFALFAHCFTCTGNYNVVRNISSVLNSKGIAVVRFDFTGLGASEGEFANSHFAANIEDLIAINQYITDHFQAPTLLIGHSLGGAAAIVAASLLDNIQAVATIAAPADIQHASNHFSGQIKDLKSNNKVNVSIGGRIFTISEEFVKGFKQHNLPEIIRSLRKPLLVMHAPFDKTVGIENAQKIYQSAMHPKSYISLDTADHLLSKKEDSLYAGNMIATWVSRYIDISPFETINPDKHQLVGHLNIVENNFTTTINTKNHSIIADEPKSVGGDDYGMSPFELVSAGLAACTVMTLKLYAKRKKWDLQEVYTFVTHKKEKVDGETKDVFSKSLQFVGDLDDKQKERLKEISSRCPVHRTLEQSSHIKTE